MDWMEKDGHGGNDYQTIGATSKDIIPRAEKDNKGKRQKFGMKKEKGAMQYVYTWNGYVISIKYVHTTVVILPCKNNVFVPTNML